MTVRELLHVQVHDPAKGSFLVNPMPVKSGKGTTKTRHCTDGNKRVVYRASHFKVRDKRTGSPAFEPHPEAMDFVVMDKSVRY